MVVDGTVISGLGPDDIGMVLWKGVKTTETITDVDGSTRIVETCGEQPSIYMSQGGGPNSAGSGAGWFLDQERCEVILSEVWSETYSDSGIEWGAIAWLVIAVLFLLFVLVAVLGLPVGFAIAIWVERRRVRALRASGVSLAAHGTDEFAIEIPLFGLRVGARWLIWFAVLMLGLLICLWMEGGVLVPLILVATAVFSALFWLHLRNLGVEYADVWAWIAWMLPMLVWSLWLYWYLELSVDVRSHWSSNPQRDYGFEFLFGGTLATGIGLIWAGLMVALAGALGRLPLPPWVPRIAVVATLPYVALLWFTEPYGYIHAAISIAVFGFVISKEVRRREDCRAERDSSSGTDETAPTDARAMRQGISWRAVAVILLSAVVATAAATAIQLSEIAEIGINTAASWAAICSAGTVVWLLVAKLRGKRHAWISAAGTVVAAMLGISLTKTVLGIFDPVESSSDFAGFIYTAVVWQAWIVAGLSSVAFVVALLRHRAVAYGAVCLGLAWPAIMLFTYDVFSHGDPLGAWATDQYLSTLAGAFAVLIVMWQLAGPGSSGDSGQSELQHDIDVAADATRRG